MCKLILILVYLISLCDIMIDDDVIELFCQKSEESWLQCFKMAKVTNFQMLKVMALKQL